MSIELDPYASWDAAYVLGALTSDERLEFERHLTACDTCAVAVAEVAGMPGLLGKVPASTALEFGDDPVGGGAVEPAEPPADLLPRLMTRARPHRRRRRLVLVGGVATAAAAAAVGVAVVLPAASERPAPDVPPGPSAPVTARPMDAVTPSPLTAEVSLVAQEWGTRVDVTCRYPAAPDGGYGYGSREYALVVTDKTGAVTQLATWTAGAGQTVTPSATTSVPMPWIASIDIRSVATDQVLLSSTF